MSKSRVAAPERLRARLEEKGWSRARLCAEMGITAPVLSRWLSGDRTPSLEMACRIEATLGIPVEAWRVEAKSA